MKSLKSKTFKEPDELTAFANEIGLTQDSIVAITESRFGCIIWYYSE